MVRSIADLGIAFVELVEAESKRLAAGTTKLAAAVAGIVIVAMVAGSMQLIGTGLLIWSLYEVLEGYFTTPAPLALTGVAVWVLIAGGALLAIGMMRRLG